MFELAPGVDLRSTHENLQRIRTSQLTWTGMTPADTRDRFVQTIESLEFLLHQVLEGFDWITHVQTDAYWVIRAMEVDRGRPWGIIESECRRLGRWLLEFEKEIERVMREDGDDLTSPRLVLDTSAIVRHKSFSDIDWASLIERPHVRLVLPALVIRQLDDLKDSGKTSKARPRLRMIRNTLEGHGRGPAPMQPGKATFELLMDPPHHVRLANPDEEIIRRGLYLKGRPGGPVLLVTGDYTMQFTAEAEGLPVLFLPDELRTGSDSGPSE